MTRISSHIYAVTTLTVGSLLRCFLWQVLAGLQDAESVRSSQSRNIFKVRLSCRFSICVAHIQRSVDSTGAPKPQQHELMYKPHVHKCKMVLPTLREENSVKPQLESCGMASAGSV